MSKTQQEVLLDAYFGVDGLRYTLLRVPIDSCDFSLEQYEASPDGDPTHFDMRRPLKYIREFTVRGFHDSRISLQNEPHAIQTWDSCLWTAEEEREFLVGHMKPALLRHGYGDIQVYIWDHNTRVQFTKRFSGAAVGLALISL